MRTPKKFSSRDFRREQTRQRILGAAIAEFKQSGMAGADVGAIVRAAGVAHGTFYFHFPTKEHVLLELERREERRIAAELTKFLTKDPGLKALLTRIVDLVMGLEDTLGNILCKELLALHFSPSRPPSDSWTDHPVVELLVAEVGRARQDGGRCDETLVHPDVDVFYSAVFFLLGLYGVLATTENVQPRRPMLEGLVDTALRGLEAKQ